MASVGPLRPLLAAADQLLAALVAHGRLSALLLLAEGPMAAKRDRGRDCALRLEQAAGLQDFLFRYYQVRPQPVCWPAALRPDAAGLIADEQVLLAAAQAMLDRLAQDAANLLEAATAITAGVEGLDPARHHLRSLQGSLPAADATRQTWTTPVKAAMAREPSQVLHGPLRTGLDPIFKPTYSILDREAVTAAGSHRAPLFWNLALRESAAAELCALSIVEHDGLPLAFHRDFAKQAWDESRHARLFLEEAIALLPEFLTQVPADHPLAAAAQRFLDSPDAGLPVPLERGLYDTIWSCSLEERLILLHVDTETPGVAGFQRELRGPFCKAHPQVAAKLEIATRDEASHARLGKAWLTWLVPNAAERQARIEQALLQRGVLILTSAARHQPVPLHALIAQRTG